MTTNNNEKLIDNAVKVAAKGLPYNDNDTNTGLTQINNLISMLQGNRTENGLRELLLYIARQGNERRRVLKPETAKMLIRDLQQIFMSQELENNLDTALDYLTYVKWAHEAIVSTDRNKSAKIEKLSDLLKLVG